MSETIATVRRKRLISSGSVIEGDLDQVSRGSPGTFHPPMYTSRDHIDVQHSSMPSTSRDNPPQRISPQMQYSPLSRTPVDSRQQPLERTTRDLGGI